jgi:soluble lytic murein transglycosylase
LPVTVVRFVIVLAAIGLFAGEVRAASDVDADSAPHAKHSSKAEREEKAEKERKAEREHQAEKDRKAEKDHKAEKDSKGEKHKDAKAPAGDHRDSAEHHPLAPPTHGPVPPAPVSSTGAIPLSPPPGSFGSASPSIIPLAAAATGAPSPLDLAAAKEAIELVHKDRLDEATNTERTISDPLTRKLVEWIILRSDDSEVDFSRYGAFIAANPTWPSLLTLRRHAEAALWQQDADPQTILSYFASEPPLSGKGYLSLARAWLAKNDNGRAYAALRSAWHNTGFSDEVEDRARQIFSGLITPADDKARMDTRLYLKDDDAALRAAHHLDPTELAIAKARIAVSNKSANSKALLDAVPAAAQHDPGYMFSRIQWLRHEDKIKEAAQLMLEAPREPSKQIDLDQWWIERRLLARKLLDIGEAKTAYEIAKDAAPPLSENYRVEREFTAGWIALEFLREPNVALAHFARISEGITNPIALARSFYWQGRAAQALGRDREARTYYETAAHYPTAYYGQLARAQLRLDDLALHELPPPAERRPLELGRAFEILYSIDQPDIVAGMAADVADKSNDAEGLAALAEITAHHNDARATVLIGKTALGRGFHLERYAFPAFGVPNYRQIGPEVERCVVYAIVRQESAFNPKDRSSANALGLMQVTPAAGRDTAKRFNVPFDQHRLMSDIAYNAQLGTAELGNDIASWRGSYILAFVAYNAGPRRAQEWIEQYGDPRDHNVDPIDWIERIPIAETRNYVERVLENMQVYRARLENNPKLLIEADLRRGG